VPRAVAVAAAAASAGMLRSKLPPACLLRPGCLPCACTSLLVGNVPRARLLLQQYVRCAPADDVLCFNVPLPCLLRRRSLPRAATAAAASLVYVIDVPRASLLLRRLVSRAPATAAAAARLHLHRHLSVTRHLRERRRPADGGVHFPRSAASAAAALLLVANMPCAGLVRRKRHVRGARVAMQRRRARAMRRVVHLSKHVHCRRVLKVPLRRLRPAAAVMPRSPPLAARERTRREKEKWSATSRPSGSHPSSPASLLEMLHTSSVAPELAREPPRDAAHVAACGAAAHEAPQPRDALTRDVAQPDARRRARDGRRGRVRARRVR
jgi:hypothetical protein